MAISKAIRLRMSRGARSEKVVESVRRQGQPACPGLLAERSQFLGVAQGLQR
jgi:hypothetical protein